MAQVLNELARLEATLTAHPKRFPARIRNRVRAARLDLEAEYADASVRFKTVADLLKENGLACRPRASFGGGVRRLG